jgi:hypothetical protein
MNCHSQDDKAKARRPCSQHRARNLLRPENAAAGDLQALPTARVTAQRGNRAPSPGVKLHRPTALPTTAARPLIVGRACRSEISGPGEKAAGWNCAERPALMKAPAERADSPLLREFLIDLLNKRPDSPPLEPGEIISTGTLTDAHPVKAGETWRTSFSGLDLPGLEIRFA